MPMMSILSKRELFFLFFGGRLLICTYKILKKIDRENKLLRLS